jgi:hypothetical protein
LSGEQARYNVTGLLVSTMAPMLIPTMVPMMNRWTLWNSHLLMKQTARQETTEAAVPVGGVALEPFEPLLKKATDSASPPPNFAQVTAILIFLGDQVGCGLLQSCVVEHWSMQPPKAPSPASHVCSKRRLALAKIRARPCYGESADPRV